MRLYFPISFTRGVHFVLFPAVEIEQRAGSVGCKDASPGEFTSRPMALNIILVVSGLFPGLLKALVTFGLAFTLLAGVSTASLASTVPLAGRVIVIDPGHGGFDPGAVDSRLGLSEDSINLSVARRLQSILMEAGARAVLTHDEAEVVEETAAGLRLPRFSLAGRVALANQNSADIFISLHVNSFRDSSRTGIEVYYCPGSEKGAVLATALEKELAGIAGERENCNRRAVAYYVLRRTEMPAVVVELGYLTNNQEAVRLLHPAHQDALARAIFIGIIRYFTGESQPIFKPVGGGTQVGKPLAAIVIDDFAGPEKNGTADFFKIARPLNFAVMPNFPNSASIAHCALQSGYQVIVHMPMEPVRGDPCSLGPGAIYVRLSEGEIKKRIDQAVASVPGAVGMNNHMGSRATADIRVTRAVLRTVKEHGLFFLDSRTTAKSIVPQVAAEVGVPCASRTLFLDNVNSQAYIRRQLRELARLAILHGSAIGIGHVGRTGFNTARAIREMIPEFEAKEIKLVYISNIIFQDRPGISGEQQGILRNSEPGK